MVNKVNAISQIIFLKKKNCYCKSRKRRYERNKKEHDRMFILMKLKSNENRSIKVKYFDNKNHRSLPIMTLYEDLKNLKQDN